MKGRIKLTLAIALALAGADALALGLGPIQVKSGLNQPLVAEIPVTGDADETGSLSVELASAEDFERVGLSRSRVSVPLEFTVAPGKSGAVIRVTTKEPVRDPFLDFLLEVNWGKGKLLREYTVLLDPPTMAPATKGSTARVAPVKQTTAAAPVEPLPAGKPSKPPRSIAAPEPAPVASKPAPRAAAGGEYGPVNTGETLWEIASATRPDGDVSLNQMMIALLRANPNAFYKDNINTLKRGAILRIPNADEVKTFGSIAAATAEVRTQNEIWRSGGTVAPTLVADTGRPTAAPKPAAESPAAKPSDRLALVPPKAGSGSQASADKVGVATGGAGDAALKSELASTKEALVSREQETNELKSRVKELEDIGSKNNRLLSLKDSELAELQKKLKELQDKSGKPTDPVVATAPVTPPPADTATSKLANPPSTIGITKEDIWGSAASEPSKSAAPPAGSSATAPTASASTVTSTPPPPSPAAPTTVTATPDAAATPPTVSTPDAASTTPAAISTTPSSSTTPLGQPAATPSVPKLVGSVTSPAAASKPTLIQPLPIEEPWYRKTWLLAIAGVALVGVVLVALMNLRRRPKTSLAKTGGTFAASNADEETMLLQQLARSPDDTLAHLELASLYYARHDVDKFEAAAQAMYAHVGDGSEAEWDQVRAMGRELAPYNPLFADAPVAADDVTPAPSARADRDVDRFEDTYTTAERFIEHPPAEEAFDFDLTDVATPTPPPTYTPAPARNFDSEFSTPAPMPAHRLDDDFSVGGEDAIGTKLDLAKAYLDMGDPEGARSMLEEVLGEGNETQKKEARKLLADIR